MIEPVIASIFIALLSISGALLFSKSGYIRGTHRFIVPIALGVFLGMIFFELIPETLEANQWYGSIAIVVGFLSFYLLSHIIRTYHHHHHDRQRECSHKDSAALLLIGDAIHNIADGVVITSAFLINPAVGIATTIGVALHEVPQEIAEYGVLISAGYSKKKAALCNFLSASTVILGVLLSLLFLYFGNYIWVITGLAAGNLLYITASDMIPELNSKTHFMQTFVSTLIGLIAMVSLLTFVT